MEGPFIPSTAKAATPAKRPLEDPASPSAVTVSPVNGSSKRRNRPPPPPIAIPAGHSAFRLLCRIPVAGGVIGKSGTIITALRQETGTKIRVEEPVPPCDERIVLIVGPDSPKKWTALSPGVEQEVSAAQEALLRVFNRALDVEVELDGAAAERKPVSCRLLALKAQVGSLMGRGGKNIERLRKESGAKIRALPAEQIPECANPEDELIQIMGDALAVKKALIAVSHYLKDGTVSDKPQVISGAQRNGPQQTRPHSLIEPLYQKNSILPSVSGSYSDYASSAHHDRTVVDRTPMLDQKNSQQEISFRLLCTNDKIGGVIGKGGSIVRALQIETGASINVAAPVTESEERVITVSASESPQSEFSQAQNAVIHVFRRSVEVGREKGESFDKVTSVTARLLVPTNQVGCLMGKGGSVIQEMRKLSGTEIRIIGGGQTPKCASENDEVVQITGELGNVQDALLQVTKRLRDNAFPPKMLNAVGLGAYSSSLPESAPYGRARPISPLLYPSMGFSRTLDRQATLAHSMDHLGLSNSFDRPSSPRLWASQAAVSRKPRVIQDIGSALPTARGGINFGSGSKSTIVTNTTIDVLVPGSVFGLVYGENGSNLSKIRQISGATVVVHGPYPGNSDGRVIISGTPDQAQAAQSLLQAFIHSGQPSRASYR